MPKFDKLGVGKIKLSKEQLDQIAGGRVALIDPNGYAGNKFRCWVDELEESEVQRLMENYHYIQVDISFIKKTKDY